MKLMASPVPLMNPPLSKHTAVLHGFVRERVLLAHWPTFTFTYVGTGAVQCARAQ